MRTPRSTRDRPAKAPLSLEAVVQAGLTVLRDEGLDAVSMRRVAGLLDTGPASLYVYVRNRDELLDHMFEAMAGEIDLGEDPDPARWREQLERLLTGVRDAMDRYPGIARVALAKIPLGPNAGAVTERALAYLRAGGVADRSAAWFLDVVFLYVNAAAYERSIYEDAGSVAQEVVETLRTHFSALDPSRWPNTVALLPHLTSGDGDERFAFGLRLMINGLLSTDPPGPTP